MLKKFIIALSVIGALCYAQANNSPNMNLPIPIPGVTSGPQWAEDINASLTLIDQHNHTPGYGVQIPPAGLNINSNLSFGGNSATNLQGSVYSPQISYTTLFGLHAEGSDLYFVDGNGNDIQLTAGGVVNATSSGISSGTATASFSAGVLIVNAASNTPANIQAASYLMGNNTLNSKYLTLQPPGAMAANYSLTFPTLPVSQKIMTLDASGNMAAPYVVDNSTITISANIIGVPAQGITSTQIANGTITTTQISATAGITRSQTAPAQQNNTVITSYSNATTSYTTIGTLTASNPVLGRPVMIVFKGGRAGSVGSVGLSNTAAIGTIAAELQITKQGGSVVVLDNLIAVSGSPATAAADNVTFSPGSFNAVDTIDATDVSNGVVVYVIQAKCTTASTSVALTNLNIVGVSL